MLTGDFRHQTRPLQNRAQPAVADPDINDQRQQAGQDVTAGTQQPEAAAIQCNGISPPCAPSERWSAGIYSGRHGDDHRHDAKQGIGKPPNVENPARLVIKLNFKLALSAYALNSTPVPPAGLATRLFARMMCGHLCCYFDRLELTGLECLPVIVARCANC